MAAKFYITTAIDYVNGEPHLGHALEKIQADVLARYHRSLGDDVFFLTGTDENAQKNVLAAEKANLPVREFIDRNVSRFKEMITLLNISNTDFIRTADKKKHWPGVIKLWQQCERAGDIYKKEYSGYYCLGCEAFVTEKDLKNGLCPEHLKPPEKISEENYFFRLSKYQGRLKELIESDELRIVPEVKKNEILSLINSGLDDFSISRPAERMKGWGIPVPDDGSQIVYVWYDALSNYITALGYGTEDTRLFEKYWPADIHVIGKGIIRFHAVYWPAMLLSAGLPLPKSIFVHEYITAGGQKMSKSLGSQVDPIELAKKYGAEPVRYFLLREISPFQDGDFTFERLEERYNSDLAKGLGNLVSRVLTMAEKAFRGEIEGEASFQFHDLFKEISEKFEQSMAEFKFNNALAAIWKLITYCDQYIERERPWERNDQQVLKNLLASLVQIASFLKPFLPETSRKIFVQLGIEKDKKPWRFKIKKEKALFPKINP